MRHESERDWTIAELGRRASAGVGTSAAFVAAAWAAVVACALAGPLSGYSDASQLVINTGTTIVTFLMVFLQNTQNRDARALRLKCIDLEDCTDEEIAKIERRLGETVSGAPECERCNYARGGRAW